MSTMTPLRSRPEAGDLVAYKRASEGPVIVQVTESPWVSRYGARIDNDSVRIAHLDGSPLYPHLENHATVLWAMLCELEEGT